MKGVNKMEELKPCPFCGGNVEIVTADPWSEEEDTFRIICQKCDIVAVFYLPKQEAIKAWNRRTSDD